MQFEVINEVTRKFGMPLHLYFPEKIRETAEEFQEVARRLYPKTSILFAVKSNPCLGAIRTVKRFGLGVDVVSEFELTAALSEKFVSSQIVCNGNAKTDAYLELAIENGATIAADSFQELGLINDIAARFGKVAQVMMRLSGMSLDGLTAPDQSTAAHWTKFGIPVSELPKFLEFSRQTPHIEPVGISAHIGTQICAEQGYERLMTVLLEAIEIAYQIDWRISKVDIGGGYPLSYIDENEWLQFRKRLAAQTQGAPKSEWATWGEFAMGGNEDKWQGKAYWTPFPGAKMLEHLLQFKLAGGLSVAERLRAVGEPTLYVEPGRSLLGNSGVTVAEVMGVKEVEGNTVVILNLGIVNHGTVLVTPDIYPMSVFPKKDDDQPVEVFVAGRLCFTGDMISKVKIRLNRLPVRGDMIVIGMTGAYCADHFASNSCGFPRPAKVALKEDGSFEVWRKGETYEDVFN